VAVKRTGKQHYQSLAAGGLRQYAMDAVAGIVMSSSYLSCTDHFCGMGGRPDCLAPEDVLVADQAYGSYVDLALVQQ
jgi:hypothetical protein